MRVVLLAATGFAVFVVALYALAGRWVALRTRRAEHLTDRILVRAHRRTVLLSCIVTVLVVLVVALLEPVIPRGFAEVAAYVGPFLWLWALVAGASWIELAGRGIDVDLWRFHRFDVFATFLLTGQRIPFFSAALVAAADLSRPRATLLSVAAHVAVAIGLGLALRWLVVARLVRTRPFPDEDLEARIAETARKADIRFRRILLVPTERGQSVNALAATSSRTIYVAEGLVEGLEREELSAVLLHELGHFAQPMTNAFRNAAIVGWPAVIWWLRAIPSLGWSRGAMPLVVTMLLAAAVGTWFARSVYHASERRADRFAAEWSPPGAFAAALRKMFDRQLTLGAPARRSTHRHPALEERLRGLERSPEETPVV